MAFLCDTPPARPRDFRDQLAYMEQLEQAGDARGELPYFPGFLSCWKQLLSNIAVAKAHDGMFPTQHGREQPKVRVAEGVEAPIGSTVTAYGGCEG